MRKTFTVLGLFCSIAMFAQTSQEHLQNGIAKHKQQDYKGAIKDYDKAIKEDKTNKEAYFNRGNCEFAQKDYKSAMADFTKTIDLDPTFVKAYYNRASVFVSQNKFTEALPDLDKTIELDPNFPSALTLRGQIRAQTGNKPGACEDFNKAKENGDEQAEKYRNQFCGNEQQAGESLMLDWPDSENWKVGNNQENAQIAMIELIHADESLEKWTEFGSMMSIKGAKNVPMDKAMNMMFDQAKKASPKAKLTFIEKDESVEYPWIIFTIEANSKNTKTLESQVWYIVQGKNALYANFRAVKEPTVPTALKEKWVKFFKTGKIVNK